MITEQRNTANPILSIGYSLGKLHTGMICYLCDLWNDGKREPLDVFLKRLGVQTKLPANIYPKKEYEHIDLVILNERQIPLIAIEMKVDDHEHPTTKRINGIRKSGLQTEVYGELLGDCVEKLFITLGAGEYYRHEVSGGFTWVRLGQFFRAVAAAAEEAKTKEENAKVVVLLLESWKESLWEEKKRQANAIRNNRQNTNQYRTGCWNIYVLGHLKERLLALADNHAKKLIYPTVYLHGQVPDTILNFGFGQQGIYDKETFPIYAEICNDGRMRIKLCFESHDIFPDLAAKQRIAAHLEKLFFTKFNDFEPERSARNTYKKTKTLLKIKVGLYDDGGLLCFKESADKAASNVIAALHMFDKIRSTRQVEKVINT